MSVFVGLDWGGQSHAVCVIAAAGKPVDRFIVTHDRDGLASLVARLKKRTSLEAPIAIEHDVAQLPEGRIVMSIPRAGKICAAQIVAELGDVGAHFQSEDQLAAEAGVAPVTYQIGKSRGVVWRWACNKRLRAALTCFADNSRHESPWAADVYKRARQRGCNHAHAARIFARAWVRILRRAWSDRTFYDIAKHPAACAFIAPCPQPG
jgi:transposase